MPRPPRRADAIDALRRPRRPTACSTRSTRRPARRRPADRSSTRTRTASSRSSSRTAASSSPSSTGPARWSDAQILEEHAFAAELAAAEIPVVAPLACVDATPHAAASAPTLGALRTLGRYRFAVTRARRPRARARRSRRAARGSAASSAASTPSARRGRSRTAPALDVATLRRREPRDWLLEHEHHPARRRSRAGAASPTRALDAVRRGLRRAPARCACCACTATAIPATCCGRDARPALRRPRRRAHGPGGAGPVDAAVGRPRGDARASSRDVLEGYEAFMDFDRARARADRAAAHAAHDPPQRLDRAALERPGLPDRLPVVRGPGATGPTRCRRCASSSRRWPSRRCGIALAVTRPRRTPQLPPSTRRRCSDEQQRVDALHVGRGILELAALGEQRPGRTGCARGRRSARSTRGA